VDIFLSYASEQRELAEEVALALRGEQHQVFFDRSALPEGEGYNARIREAIEACDVFIFLVSPQAVSPGRYTLTELRFAGQRWPNPAGRVLPVVVQPTDPAAIPAYLRAIVMLRPEGNVGAEVVAAVGRLSMPPWRRLLRRWAIPLAVAGFLAGGLAGWRAIEGWRDCDRASTIAAAAKLQQDAGDYAAAWNHYSDAVALCSSRDGIARDQQSLAMRWLENIRIDPSKESFTAVVAKLEPVLSRAAASKDKRRAADALAHLGWADFLRTREGKAGLDPSSYYRQALSLDRSNPYAHAFWGHYLLVMGGDVEAARQHFTAALASTAERPFIRGVQMSALQWKPDPRLTNEALRIASDMRAHGEPLPATSGESLVSALWNEYYAALIRGNDTARFLAALPAADHLATYLWLFPAYANSSNREPYLFMLARLQEDDGDRAAALATYRSVLTALSARGVDRGTLVEATRAAVRRLQGQ